MLKNNIKCMKIIRKFNKRSSLLCRDNFNLSKEAEEYASKLIERCKESEKQFGGIVSISNIKLDDNGEEVESGR